MVNMNQLLETISAKHIHRRPPMHPCTLETSVLVQYCQKKSLGVEISGIQEVFCNEQTVRSARPAICTLKESKHQSLTFNELESDH